MNKIYRYNPNAEYIPKQWPGGIDLSGTHMQIYVNEYEYVMLDVSPIFLVIIKLFSEEIGGVNAK